MTLPEFRVFFDALPEKLLSLKAPLPTQKAFALECNVPLITLRQIRSEEKALTEPLINQLLPVMRRYGFKG